MATKVLIVDDEACVRDVFRLTLAEFDCEVYYAESISEAIKVATEKVFDIAFVDIVLEDGSGVDFLRQIEVLHPTLPCCLLTGHPDKFAKVQEEFNSAGKKLRIMLKPVWPEQIIEAAKALLEHGLDATYCNIDMKAKH